MARSMGDRKAREWQQRLIRFEKSRRTINEFCQHEGVSPQSFYLWRKRLVPARPAQQRVSASLFWISCSAGS